MFALGAEPGHLPWSDDSIGDIVVNIAEVKFLWAWLPSTLRGQPLTEGKEGSAGH